MTTPYRTPADVAAAPTRSLFSNYTNAKNAKMAKWAPPLMAASFLFVTFSLTAGWAKSIWDIEMLDRPKVSTDLAVAPPPPPPPPPPKGGAKPHETIITPKKIKVKDLVQPVKIEKQETPKEEDKGQVDGEENGVEGGVAGGVVGGDLNGVMGAPPPPPPPPPPPAPPTNVAPTMLEGSRIAGEKQIQPDEVTQTEINRSGKTSITGTFKLCLTIAGDVGSITMLRSTGFPKYDSKIQNTIRGEWRYRPYAVNGKVVPVCTAVTFIYRIAT